MAEPKPAIHMWAVVPPSPIAEEIDALRHEFSAAYNAYKALKPPVHLTLYKPFRAPEMRLMQHINEFEALLSSLPPFTLTLHGFDFFEHQKSPVVFIGVQPNDMLDELNWRLCRQTIALLDLPAGNTRFHPHFTIGYRDVSPRLFPQVKEAYGLRPYDATFDVSSISLFRHNGLSWELIRTICLATGLDL